jgi:hypothetical protein
MRLTLDRLEKSMMTQMNLLPLCYQPGHLRPVSGAVGRILVPEI